MTAIIRQRALEDYGFERLEPSALAKVVSERAAVPLAVAEALAWGEPVQLSMEQLNRIADTFCLHRDVLAMLVSPTSRDVITHVFDKVILDQLNSEECRVCYDLEEQVLHSEELDEDALTELALGLLEHLGRATDAPHFTLDDDGPDLVESLLGVVVGLSPEAQMRVLAFACNEATGVDVDASALRLKAFSSLRQNHFTRLVKSVFDQLAVSRTGELTRSELVSRLNLRDGRSLSQLTRSIQSAIKQLPDANVQEQPLIVKRRGKDRVYALTTEARETWLSLLRAENNPLLLFHDPVI